MESIKLNSVDLENVKRDLLPFIDCFQDAMVVFDNEKRIICWNKQASKLTGLNATEVISLNYKEIGISHLDEKGNELCNTNCIFDEVKNASHCIKKHVMLKNIDNSIIPICLKLVPIKNIHDENIGFIEFFNAKLLDNDLNNELIKLRNKVEDYGEITNELIKKNNVLNEKLLRLSNTDMLTNLNNRRSFYLEAQKQLDNAKRYNHITALIMMDIDFFKKINDKFGHLVGDKVLQDVSKIIIESTRSSDIKCRFGGEEFIVMLPQTDKENTLITADKIRNNVEMYKFAYDDLLVPVTLSLGVALSHKNGQFIDIDLSKMINRADIALYEAKESGRNRVVFKD